MPEEDRRAFLEGVVSNRMRFFVPNGAQEQYINLVGHCLDDVRLPVVIPTFGNGVGKTLATVHIVGNLVEGPQNKWFDLPLFTNPWTYPKLVWYCSTAENIKSNVIPMFREIFKDGVFEEDYEDFKDGKSWVARLLLKGGFDKGGWEIHFKTYEQDDDAYEGSTVGLIIADEPMPESKWKACKSRRRMGCVMLLPMTPLYCQPYLIDEVLAAADKGIKGYYHIEVDLYLSCKERGVRGHRDREVIDEEVAQYDEEEREARVYGKLMYYSRRIYPTVSKDFNVRGEEEYPIHKNAVLMMVADPHDSRPFAVAWVAINPALDGDDHGRMIVFAESPRDQSRPFWEFKRSKTLSEEALEWKRVEGRWMEKLGRSSNEVYRVLDRHFGWNTRRTKAGDNTTLAEMLSKVGTKIDFPMYFSESYSSNSPEGEIQVGHKMVREQMLPLADGESGTIIYPHCYHMLNGLTHYVRKGIKGAAADDRVAADAPIVEKFKDFPDVKRMATGTRMQSFIPKPPKDTFEEWADKIDEPALFGGEEAVFDMDGVLE